MHDAAEDAGGRPTLEEIRRRFGERVAHIVDGCTDTFNDPKPAWRPRKEQYIAHVRTADADTRLVSADDKLHNVREIIMDVRQHGESVWQRFSGKRDGSLWYYRALVDAFRAGDASPDMAVLVDELDSEVSELERLAGVPSVNR